MAQPIVRLSRAYFAPENMSRANNAARQMDTLQAMLAQRPILETAGVAFDRIANYDPLWKIEEAWRF